MVASVGSDLDSRGALLRADSIRSGLATAHATRNNLIIKELGPLCSLDRLVRARFHLRLHRLSHNPSTQPVPHVIAPGLCAGHS